MDKKEKLENIVNELPDIPEWDDIKKAAKANEVNPMEIVKFVLQDELYGDFGGEVAYAVEKEFTRWYPFDMDSDADGTWAYYAAQDYITKIKNGKTNLSPKEAAELAFKEDEPELAEIVCGGYLPTFLEVLEEAIAEEDGFYSKLFDVTESIWVQFDENDIKMANTVIENISKISAVDILHCFNNNYFSNIHRGNRYARFDFYDCVKDLYDLITQEEGEK